jgi:hypothetical protein
MGRSTYRPEDDSYRDYRCVCLHLTMYHDNDGAGACEFQGWCGCGRYVPAIDPETGKLREAS